MRMESELISRQEAADVLGVSLDTVDRHLRQRIFSFTLGRRVLFRRVDVLTMVGRVLYEEPFVDDVDRERESRIFQRALARALAV